MAFEPKSVEELKLHKKVVDNVQTLVTSTNVMNQDEVISNAILHGLLSSHPTLRQSFIRNFVKAMESYSQLNGDARDQASREFAKDITAKGYTFPFI